MKAMPKKTLQYPFDARFTQEDLIFWNKTHTFADILQRDDEITTWKKKMN